MKLKKMFTADEYKELSSALNKILHIHGIPKTNLNYIIDKWIYFINKVGQGYDDSIYEYINDLSARDLLEEIIQKLSNHLKSKIIEVIKEYDEKFYNLTTQIDKPIISGYKYEERPWLFCIPKKPGKELEYDLKNEGFIK